MKHYQDMTGSVYNNLIVLEFVEIRNKNAHWKCKCKLCGNHTVVSRPNLRSGNTTDCGCQRSDKISSAITKHGKSKTPTWNSWSKMHRRIKQGAEHSPIYGKITIDPSWDSFDQFYIDMGERPKNCTLDRIDNTKGYSKENCRWATQAEQNRNRSTNVLITYKDKTQCISDWEKELKLYRGTIRRRLKRGVPIDKVLAVGSRNK